MKQRAHWQLLLPMRLLLCTQALLTDLQFSITVTAARSLLPVSSFKPRTAKTSSLVSVHRHYFGTINLQRSRSTILSVTSSVVAVMYPQQWSSAPRQSQKTELSTLRCRHLLLHSAKHHRVQCYQDWLLDGSISNLDSPFCCSQP